MKTDFVLSLILLITIGTTSFLIPHLSIEENLTRQFYVGVTFCGNTTTEGKMLVDRVKSCTNLFVVDSIVINKNETALNELCDYAVTSGLHVIVYFGDFNFSFPWQLTWINATKQRLGDWFLGVYYYDEPGGIQLDFNWANTSTGRIPNYSNMSRDYDKAAASFIYIFKNYPNFKALRDSSIPAFTSDYALYWFDYLAGYDVLLAHFGWNHTLAQDIALIRGAARLQNKDWGAIITWKYTEEPYLDNGAAIYNQTLMAYEAGAKYVVIFNYPKIGDNPYGIMKDEHFEALEKFWNDVTTEPDLRAAQGSTQVEAVLVLPSNYGWGMRRPDDRIWGFWGPDEKSPQIWEISRRLLSQYGIHLDIVYDDPAFPVAGKYPRVYYWNTTI